MINATTFRPYSWFPMSEPLAHVRVASLPPSRSRLIGRGQEVADVVALLHREDVPLVTVTGPGGVGKTRLALAVSRKVGPDFEDGVWLVRLAAVRNTAHVPSAVAQALGLREASDVPVEERVRRFLADRQALLVLDNVEQVVAAAPFVASVIDACPGVTVLATSRTRLRIADEQEFALSPLATPVADLQPTPELVAGNDAVALFVERAQAVLPQFRLDTANVAAVVGICRRLDGQPLAIELAAARTKTLAPAALLDRLERSLVILVDGRRDAPVRHQTLRDAIAWSYDLLSEPERAVLRRLATFVGGFSIEAAEALCADLRIDTLQVIASLVDQSLVQHLYRPGHPEGDTGYLHELAPPSHRLLETVREFGLDQFGDGAELEAVRQHHADYFIDLAERLAPPGWDYGTRPVDDADVHLGNWWAVFDLARARDDRRLACRLANALHGYWAIRCHIVEGRSWLEWILEDDQLSPDDRALAELGHGLLLFIHGEYPLASARLDHAIAHFRSTDDRPQLFRALMWRGEVALFSGDEPRAGELFEECLAMARQGGSLRREDGWEAWPLKDRSFLASRHDDLAQAKALLEASLVVARETGHRWATASAASELGVLARREGRHADAAAWVLQALALFDAAGDVAGVAFTLGDIALLSVERGGGERAAELLGATEGHLETVGREPWPLTADDSDRAKASLRHELGEAAFSGAFGRGYRSSLGAAVALAKVEAERLAHGAEEGAAPPGPPGPLSAREVEVIALLAAGKSDQEISDELFVSRRTASTHVSNILTKLSLANRTEAAAWAVRQGLA